VRNEDVRQLGVPVGREQFLPGRVERRVPETRKVLGARRVRVADPHDVVLLGDPVCAQGHMPVRRAEDDRLGLAHVCAPPRLSIPSASSPARRAWRRPTNARSPVPSTAPAARLSASPCDGWGSVSQPRQWACGSPGPVDMDSPLRSVAEIGCRTKLSEDYLRVNRGSDAGPQARQGTL
jgi:hypothetical protein